MSVPLTEVQPMTGFLNEFGVRDEELYDGIACFVNSVTRRGLGKLDKHTVVDYLKAKAIPSVSILTALIFIEKFANANPPSQLLEEITAVDLFAIAMTTASKYLHDVDTVDGSDNATWASVFNMDLKDLNQLEIRFLSAMNWSLFVDKSEYEQFESVVHSLAVNNRCDRSRHSSSSKRPCPDTVARKQLKHKRFRTTAKLLALLTAACLTSFARKPEILPHNSAPSLTVPPQDPSIRQEYPYGSASSAVCSANCSSEFDALSYERMVRFSPWPSIPSNCPLSVSPVSSAILVNQMTDILLSCGG